VRSFGERAGVEGRCLKDLLDGLDRRLGAEKAAIQRAAQEAFDRLMAAMDPETIRNQAEGKGWKVGPFQKASLYDVWEEKYAQLKAYHDRGRLVGDLRAAFRKHAGSAAKSEEGE
jgi:predicted component of type VI protein secretion system